MRSALKPSRSLALAVLLVVSVVLTLLGPAAAGRLRSMVHWAFVPAGDAGMFLVTTAKKAAQPSDIISEAQARQFKSNNEKLRRQVFSLTARLSQMNENIQAGRSVISGLFGRWRDVPVKLVPARIVGGDSLPYGQTRLLNVGEKKSAGMSMAVTTRQLVTDRSESMPKNLAVLSGESLVGKLTETAAFTARLTLVTDRSSAIRAQLVRVINHRNPRMIQYRNRLQRLSNQSNYPIDVIAMGNGKYGMIIREVKKEHKVRIGDKLRTAPDSPSLPVAVDIGTVTEVLDDPKHPGMMTLHVRPTAEMTTLREVFVAVPKIGKLPGKGGK